jgi:type IV pilus assembly protein PilE
MKTQKGFSLIELMIVVAIVGIIAVIAVPSYQSYVVKGNRAAAQAFMTDVANREKQYLLDARAYTNSFVTLAISAPAEVSRHYNNIAIACNDGVSAATGCTVVANTPPSFTITATPTSSQQTGDGWLSLDNAGVKGSEFSGKW